MLGACACEQSLSIIYVLRWQYVRCAFGERSENGKCPKWMRWVWVGRRRHVNCKTLGSRALPANMIYVPQRRWLTFITSYPHERMKCSSVCSHVQYMPCQRVENCANGTYLIILAVRAVFALHYGTYAQLILSNEDARLRRRAHTRLLHV